MALAAGVAGIVYDETQRDSSGYLMTGPEMFSTTAYALVSNSYQAGTSGDIAAVRDILGTVRVRAETPGRAFVGIARATDVASYLGSVRHAVVDSFDSGEHLDVIGRGEPATPPAAQTFWAVSSAGAGPQTISWDPKGGSWRIVVMKASAAPGVIADVEIGAKIPNLIWFGVGFLVAGLFLLALGGFLVYVGVRRR